LDISNIEQGHQDAAGAKPRIGQEDSSMELRHEQQELALQRVFGSGATLTGSIGSGRHPGVLTITVDGVPWGSGATLQEAIGQALGEGICATIRNNRLVATSVDQPAWPGSPPARPRGR
jgi:hypothetical protein